MGTLKKIFTASLWAVLALLGLGGLASAVPFTASVMTNPVYSATEMPPSAVVREAWDLDTDRPQPLTLGLNGTTETAGWKFTLTKVDPGWSATFDVQYGSSGAAAIVVDREKIAWVESHDGDTTITWNLRLRDDPQHRLAQMTTCQDNGSPWWYTGCKQHGTTDLNVTDDPVAHLIRNVDSVIVTLTDPQHQQWCRP